MTNRLIIFVLLCIVAINSMAQSVISGRVSNAVGNGVDFVSVIASPANAPKTILASAFTDENGQFQMSVKSECDSLILKASSVEITPTQILVPNRSGSYEIIVENRALELKEVVVKSKRVYSQGDTINYNVGSFLSQIDQSIADVLKKMPGISVSDAGQISYQGKPIKNLYIEGLDLMKEHISVETASFSPPIRATIQGRICRRNFIPLTTIIRAQAISRQSPCRRLLELINGSITSTAPIMPRLTTFIV